MIRNLLLVLSLVGFTGQAMAKKCETEVSFRVNTGGPDLVLKSLETGVRGGMDITKSHSVPNLVVKNGELIKVKVTLAQRCDLRRYIKVGLNHSGSEVSKYKSGIAGKGVMYFGTIDGSKPNNGSRECSWSNWVGCT